MLKIFRKKSSESKTSSNKDLEISGPVEFQILQWFNLKKWKNTESQLRPPKPGFKGLLIYRRFFSVTDKLRMDLVFGWKKEGRDYKIAEYMACISLASFGGALFEGLSDMNKYLDRSTLLKLGADPTQFEFWFNYESGKMGDLSEAEERML